MVPLATIHSFLSIRGFCEGIKTVLGPFWIDQDGLQVFEFLRHKLISFASIYKLAIGVLPVKGLNTP